MATTTTTTIRGVSLYSRQRLEGDTFDIALSLGGIDIERPGQPVQRLSWDRISEWEIEEHPDHVVLTLRGAGAATPLVVPGWTSDRLEILLRDLTAGHTDVDTATAAPPAAAPGPTAPTPESRSDRHEREHSRLSSRRAWKVVVTVVLLGAVATAVTLVLLQSAGVINWGFLGPTA